MVNMPQHGGVSPTIEQLRAARALIGLSVQALSGHTGLGVNTIARAEKNGLATLTPANAARLVEVLERLGVEFLPDNGRGPGLRYRRTQ